MFLCGPLYGDARHACGVAVAPSPLSCSSTAHFFSSTLVASPQSKLGGRQIRIQQLLLALHRSLFLAHIKDEEEADGEEGEENLAQEEESTKSESTNFPNPSHKAKNP
jgi:hypothetical protein